MSTVCIYIHNTIKGRRKSGAAGYVIALKKDGEPDDHTAIKEVMTIENMVQNQAELYVLAKAIGRIRAKVDLEIWTGAFLVAMGPMQGWIDKWIANDFDGIKNAEEWKTLLRTARSRGLDLKKATWHVAKPHPFEQLLIWECNRKGEKNGQQHQTAGNPGDHGSSAKPEKGPRRPCGADGIDQDPRHHAEPDRHGKGRNAQRHPGGV